jgi:hypothetical protein
MEDSDGLLRPCHHYNEEGTVRQRIVKTIVIAIVALTIAAPSAFAMFDPAGAGPVESTPNLPTTIPHLSHGIGVDAAQFVGTGSASTAVRPDDRAGTRTSEPSALTSGASTGQGFDWADAGIGGGSAAGLLLLIGLGGATVQRSRKAQLIS